MDDTQSKNALLEIIDILCEQAPQHARWKDNPETDVMKTTKEKILYIRNVWGFLRKKLILKEKSEIEKKIIAVFYKNGITPEFNFDGSLKILQKDSFLENASIHPLLVFILETLYQVMPLFGRWEGDSEDKSEEALKSKILFIQSRWALIKDKINVSLKNKVEQKVISVFLLNGLFPEFNDDGTLKILQNNCPAYEAAEDFTFHETSQERTREAEIARETINPELSESSPIPALQEEISDNTGRQEVDPDILPDLSSGSEASEETEENGSDAGKNTGGSAFEVFSSILD